MFEFVDLVFNGGVFLWHFVFGIFFIFLAGFGFWLLASGFWLLAFWLLALASGFFWLLASSGFWLLLASHFWLLRLLAWLQFCMNFLHCLHGFAVYFISVFYFVHEFLYFCMDVMQFYMSIFFFALNIFMFSNLALWLLWLLWMFSFGGFTILYLSIYMSIYMSIYLSNLDNLI